MSYNVGTFYADLKDKRDAVFKRLTGVRPPTFAAMCRALIRCLKVFHILSERYRNRRRRFGLRFNLIAGLYNYELAH